MTLKKRNCSCSVHNGKKYSCVKAEPQDSLLNKQGVCSCWTSPHGPDSGQRREWAHVWRLGSCATAGECCSDTRQSRSTGSQWLNMIPKKVSKPQKAARPLSGSGNLLAKKRHRSRRSPSRRSLHRWNVGHLTRCCGEEKEKRKH